MSAATAHDGAAIIFPGGNSVAKSAGVPVVQDASGIGASLKNRAVSQEALVSPLLLVIGLLHIQ